MNEARAVLDRLERVEALDRAGADRPTLLTELRALLVDAEAWSRVEGGMPDSAPSTTCGRLSAVT